MLLSEGLTSDDAACDLHQCVAKATGLPLHLAHEVIPPCLHPLSRADRLGSPRGLIQRSPFARVRFFMAEADMQRLHVCNRHCGELAMTSSKRYVTYDPLCLEAHSNVFSREGIER